MINKPPLLLLHSSDKNKSAIKLVQIHYTAWPDFGAPEETETLIDLVKEARRIIKSSLSQKQSKINILVHCSAGVGRTGTFVALYQMMELLDTLVPRYVKEPSKGSDLTIDIFNTVFKLRGKRIMMVSQLNFYNISFFW